RRSHMSGTEQSAVKPQSRASLIPLDDSKLHPRRDRIASAIRPYEQKIAFEKALDVLGLTAKFKTFEDSNISLFKTLAERAPAFVGHTMVRTNVALPKTHKDSAYIGRTNERAVTAYFLELLQSMEAEVVKHNKRC
ncbi:hypothetical protein IWW47_003364, partial [Coemansia sp. RSA 2052]